MLVGAWCCHPVFIYSLFRGGAALEGSSNDIMKMAMVSLCLCVLLFTIKKWARALVIVGNAFIVVYDLFWFLIVPSDKLSTVLCVMVVLFAIVGMVWLFSKDTRDYYTRLNPKTESSDPPGPSSPSHRPSR